MSAEVLASWIFKGVVSAFLSWLWYGKTRLDKRIDELTAKSAITPTNDEVDKRIDKATSTLQNSLEKELASAKADQKEMMVLIKEMSAVINQLAREQAVTNELRRYERAKTKGDDSR